MQKKNIILLIAVLVILVVAGVTIFITSKPLPQPQVSQPPAEELPKKEEIDTSTTSTSSVQDWQTYRNEKYGFEVKYPPNWKDIGRYSSDPQPGGIEFDVGFGDPTNQFRTLRILVWEKEYAPEFDPTSGQVLSFSGGRGTRIGNMYFFTEKNDYIIQLWHTHEGYTDEFFTKILSTFKFILQ